MAHDVFISYSSRDKLTADAMCAFLEAAEIRCWIAPRDVQPGASWAKVIPDAIRAARAFVLVFSTSSNDSSDVAREVAIAVRAEHPVIPFRLDSTTPGGELEYYISSAHWLDAMTPPLEAHLRRLRDTLLSLLGLPAATVVVPTPPPAPPPPAPGPAVPRRRPLGALLAVGLLAAGVGGFLALRGNGTEPADGRDSLATDPAPRVDVTGSAGDLWPAAVTQFLVGWAQPEGNEADATTGYPKRIRRAKDSMVMVLIPAGTFQMGAVPGDGLASENEKPRHAVTLTKAYYLDESEITVGMWKKYAGEKGIAMPELRSETTDSHPMHEVSWDDVQIYVAWAGVALPTEAQWERAAKGGHDDHVYPWGATDDFARRNGIGALDGFAGLAPVKSYAANEYGLYDMSGNVWEWCANGYDAKYYESSPPRDPAGPLSSASSRVLRGGGGSLVAGALRSSSRSTGPPAYDGGFVGFRCARSLP